MRTYSYPNRYLCDALESMRAMSKTKNYALLDAAIEEVQYAANRMEAALQDSKDIIELRNERGKLKSEVNDLKQKLAKMKKDAGIKEKKKEE